MSALIEELRELRRKAENLLEAKAEVEFEQLLDKINDGTNFMFKKIEKHLKAYATIANGLNPFAQLYYFSNPLGVEDIIETCQIHAIVTKEQKEEIDNLDLVVAKKGHHGNVLKTNTEKCLIVYPERFVGENEYFEEGIVISLSKFKELALANDLIIGEPRNTLYFEKDTGDYAIGITAPIYENGYEVSKSRISNPKR